MKSLAAFFLLVSCAHYKDVRPRTDGLHQVVYSVDSRYYNSRDGLSQARTYCEEKMKNAKVVSENVYYIGQEDERSLRDLRGVQERKEDLRFGRFRDEQDYEEQMYRLSKNYNLKENYVYKMQFRCL